jgi:hypothetical protein
MTNQEILGEFLSLPAEAQSQVMLVSQIFRAGSKTKNRALLHKGFRKPKSGARINKDTNK